MTEKLSERLHTEATARVTWGEVPEDVAQYLVSQGMDCREAARLVNQLVTERNREVRGRSSKRLMTGIGLVFAAVIFFACLPWRDWYDWLVQFQKDLGWGRGRRRNSGLASLMVAAVIGIGGAGLWSIWRGFWGLITPQAEELSDVE